MTQCKYTSGTFWEKKLSNFCMKTSALHTEIPHTHPAEQKHPSHPTVSTDQVGRGAAQGESSGYPCCLSHGWALEGPSSCTAHLTLATCSSSTEKSVSSDVLPQNTCQIWRESKSWHHHTKLRWDWGLVVIEYPIHQEALIPALILLLQAPAMRQPARHWALTSPIETQEISFKT